MKQDMPSGLPAHFQCMNPKNVDLSVFALPALPVIGINRAVV